MWPALWPPLGVAGLFVCAALLDLPSYLPPAWHLALLAGTAATIVGLLARGLWPIRAPDDAAADRRLERASGLPHRPLAVLTDRPAQHDPMGVALWQAHLARTIRQVRRLRVGTPHPGLPRRDRYALRAALVVALIAAFGIAGRGRPVPACSPRCNRRCHGCRNRRPPNSRPGSRRRPIRIWRRCS